MNGYSAYCQASRQKSRSIDFSGFYTPLHETRAILRHDLKDPDRKLIQNTQNNVNSDPEEEDSEAGEMFGVILSRLSSVKSTSYHVENEESVLDSAVGRVFSMRRTFSVGEGYSRIQHSDDGDEQSTLHKKRRSKRKRFHFLRRLFGF